MPEGVKRDVFDAQPTDDPSELIRRLAAEVEPASWATEDGSVLFPQPYLLGSLALQPLHVLVPAKDLACKRRNEDVALCRSGLERQQSHPRLTVETPGLPLDAED